MSVENQINIDVVMNKSKEFHWLSNAETKIPWQTQTVWNMEDATQVKMDFLYFFLLEKLLLPFDSLHWLHYRQTSWDGG